MKSINNLLLEAFSLEKITLDLNTWLDTHIDDRNHILIQNYDDREDYRTISIQHDELLTIYSIRTSQVFNVTVEVAIGKYVSNFGKEDNHLIEKGFALMYYKNTELEKMNIFFDVLDDFETDYLKVKCNE